MKPAILGTGISPATLRQRGTKQFKVVRVSENTNSFGLRGHWLIAKDGEAWEIACSATNCKKIGDVIDVPYDTAPLFITLTWSAEIPRRLQKAPQNVIDLVWDKNWKG